MNITKSGQSDYKSKKKKVKLVKKNTFFMFKILLDNEIYHKEVSYSYHLKRLFIKKTHVK